MQLKLRHLSTRPKPLEPKLHIVLAAATNLHAALFLECRNITVGGDVMEDPVLLIAGEYIHMSWYLKR